MKTNFDFSRPRPAWTIYAQTYDVDAEHWRPSVVLFVVGSGDEEVKEQALTEEVNSRKDWTLVEEKRDERLLLFNGSRNRYGKIFAVQTTIYEVI